MGVILVYLLAAYDACGDLIAQWNDVSDVQLDVACEEVAQ